MVLQRNDLICFSETWRDFKDNYVFDFDENFIEFRTRLQISFRTEIVRGFVPPCKKNDS